MAGVMGRGMALPPSGSEERRLLEEEMVKMYNAGMSSIQISGEMAIPAGTIYSILHKHGVNMRRVGAGTVSDEEIIARYQSGEEVMKIVRETGREIYRVLRKHGIENRRSKEDRAREIRLDVAVKMYQEGATVRDINKATRIWWQQLYEELVKRGVTMRNETKKKLSRKVWDAMTPAQQQHMQEAGWWPEELAPATGAEELARDSAKELVSDAEELPAPVVEEATGVSEETTVE